MRFSYFPWLLSLLLLLSLLFHNTPFVNSQCLNHQKNLLLQLKQTIPSNVSKLNSWVSNTDCCSWEGIECDPSGYVTALDLNNSFLTNATLFTNSTIFQLQHLEKLSLAYNNFNTPIPIGLGRLANLTHLNLSNSGFVDQVPIQITNLTRLVSLDLSTLFVGKNSLKLQHPDLEMLVRNLWGLQELYLSNVNISNHEIPEVFGNFINLHTLHLSTCGLVGKFPENIFQLPLLQTLDVSFNPKLVGSIPDFPQNASLENLVLSYTNFSGELPNSIGNLRLLSNLKLVACNFTGSIPNTLSNLTRLVIADLSSNQFSGTIPNFGLSENLTQMNLAHNNLSGTILSQWENHAKLVSLNLRNNFLNGTIPSFLFRLPLLQKLYLSDNGFTGRLAEFSNASSSLDTIDISGNRLEGPIPQSIFNLSGLIIFTASFNKFNGSLSLGRFQKFNNLSSLDLSSNNLTIEISGAQLHLFPQVSTLKLGSCNLRRFPEFLSNQSRLSFLDLSNNGIRGRMPSWIPQICNGGLINLNLSRNFLEPPEQPFPPDSCKNLFVLDLHQNLLTGPIPILPQSASVLDYSSNNLTSSIPIEIDKYLSVIMFFSLSCNNFTGEIPGQICKASFLQVLDLSTNNLSGPIPACLTSMKSLKVLNLRENKLHGAMPETFPTGCSLRTLDFSSNRLEGNVSESMYNCTMLEVLNLGNNQIMGTFPRWLGKLENLRVLVLRHNKFNGTLQNCEINGTFSMLQILDLSSNRFTGRISRKPFSRWKGMMMTNEEAQSKSNRQPLNFGVLPLSRIYYQDSVTVTSKGMQMELVKILTIFTSIDVSNNSFEGMIPETLANLTSLYILNLSRNELSGTIPSSLGKLTQLESLDLSNNKLSGEIPVALTNLSFLSFLNLSDNQLNGTIPHGSQFQTFGNDSFIGNEELCGPPLSKKCGNSSKSTRPQLFSDSGIDFDWQFIVVGLGFGAGAGLAICPLVFWPKGRKWYDDLTDKVVSIILPSPKPVYHVYDDSKDNTEESLQEDLWTDTEDYDGEEQIGGQLGRDGRYCVFCSKLDIRRKRVLHDPKCKCHVSSDNSSSSLQKENLYIVEI